MSTERPIDIRYIDEPNPLDVMHGSVRREPRRMVWLRARGTYANLSGSFVMRDSRATSGHLGGEKEFQTLHRCVVAYASDFMLLGTSLLPHGGHWGNPKVKMTVSLVRHSRLCGPATLLRSPSRCVSVCACAT